MTFFDDSKFHFEFYRLTAKTKYITILNDEMEYVLVPHKTVYNFDDTHFIVIYQEGIALYVSETKNMMIKNIDSKIWGLKTKTKDLQKLANKVGAFWHHTQRVTISVIVIDIRNHFIPTIFWNMQFIKTIATGNLKRGG